MLFAIIEFRHFVDSFSASNVLYLDNINIMYNNKIIILTSHFFRKTTKQSQTYITTTKQNIINPN